MKHKEQALEVIFYDFCCSLHEYCLNREPKHFRGVDFFTMLSIAIITSVLKHIGGRGLNRMQALTLQAEQFISQ